MFCSKCGSQMNDSAAFCPNCGAPSGSQQGANVQNQVNNAPVNPQNFGAGSSFNHGGTNGQPPVNNQYTNNGMNGAPNYSNQYNQQYSQPPVRPEDDVPNAGYCVLSFLIPLFGIIIYATEHKKKPNACKRYLMLSLIAIGLAIVITIISLILVAIFADDVVTDYYRYSRDLYDLFD